MALSKVSTYGVDEYRLKINDGGNILLDPGSGGVTIVGDLDVLGSTTTIGSTELIVADKTITVNDQSTSPSPTVGVPDIGDGLGRTAGIIVDRGTLPNVYIFFDENKNFLNPLNGSNTNGALKFENEFGTLIGIYTSSIKANYNPIGTSAQNSLYVLSQGNGVINVTGTVDYEKQVFPYTGSAITPNVFNQNRLSDPIDDDIIPNIKSVIDYVRDYHLYNWQNAIKSPTPDGNTSVIAYDTDAGDPSNKVEVSINGLSVAEFYANEIFLEEISIVNDTIKTRNINGNLTLEANGTGNINTEFPINLEKRLDPSAPVDGVKIYSKLESDGGTGLFFVNENNTRDEIISRSKALLYSIIF